MQFNTQRPYIHGQFVDASSSETFQSINPANAEVLATIQACNQADVDRAVQSAKQGQKVWAAMTTMQRSRILNQAVAILRARNDELAEIESLDSGKPLSETRSVDIVTGADVLEYYASILPALEGRKFH